jgi:hypothetical protein
MSEDRGPQRASVEADVGEVVPILTVHSAFLAGISFLQMLCHAAGGDANVTVLTEFVTSVRALVL